MNWILPTPQSISICRLINPTPLQVLKGENTSICVLLYKFPSLYKYIQVYGVWKKVQIQQTFAKVNYFRSIFLARNFTIHRISKLLFEFYWVLCYLHSSSIFCCSSSKRTVVAAKLQKNISQENKLRNDFRYSIRLLLLWL